MRTATFTFQYTEFVLSVMFTKAIEKNYVSVLEKQPVPETTSRFTERKIYDTGFK